MSRLQLLSSSDYPFGQGALRLSGAELLAALLLAKDHKLWRNPSLFPALLLSSESAITYGAAPPHPSPKLPVAPSRPPVRVHSSNQTSCAGIVLRTSFQLIQRRTRATEHAHHRKQQRPYGDPGHVDRRG